MTPPNINDTLSAISNMKEDFISYLIMMVIIAILIALIVYIFYLRRLKSSECDYMKDLYESIDGYIRPLDINDPDCSGNLYDYYIKTAYNACSGGNYKNDFVDVCNLKSVIGQGVRCLDFELYSIDDKPIVATSTSDSYYIKETFNYVDFNDVMKTIQNYAFASSTAPNYTDPILINLRIMSNNQTMYTNLANILASYEDMLLSKENSFENNGKNIAGLPITSFMNKCLIIVDKTNTAFLDNEEFLEYVNLTSNSVFMRSYHYNDIKDNPDVDELTNFNRRGMTIVYPEVGTNPDNPSGILCREYGCQMVAMRFQFVDDLLEENTLFFDRCTYAFCLKPERLRYVPVTIPLPDPQNPEYSYATRKVESDYYSFDV